MAPPPPPRIRPARLEEAGALRDVVRAAYARWVPLIGHEPAPMTDEYGARTAAGQAFVLEAEDGAMLGSLVLEEDGPHTLLLANVAPAQAVQGRGLGRALMDFAEAEARRRSRHRLRLYANAAIEANISLHARPSYVEASRVQEDGFSRVYMEKRLS